MDPALAHDPTAPGRPKMAFKDAFIQRGRHRMYAREHAGDEPVIVLMHGFPDNSHLYDRLVPHLSPPRRVVVFDFLGWGSSDKPAGYPYTATNQMGDLDTVIEQLQLEHVVLVAHDASGPPAIDWALAHPDRVAALVLLNTYYCDMPTLRPPEAIWLFSTPVVRRVARPLSSMFNHLIFRRMYRWQVGRFFRDAEVKEEFLPLLYRQFDATPSARPAFFRLNEDLLPTVRSRTSLVPRLKAFTRPVRIIFGDDDPYLNPGVARCFREWFPRSELFLLAGARHFVQMDEPERVAHLILTTPTTKQADSAPGTDPGRRVAARRLWRPVAQAARAEVGPEWPGVMLCATMLIAAVILAEELYETGVALLVLRRHPSLAGIAAALSGPAAHAWR